jgi:ferredoxin
MEFAMPGLNQVDVNRIERVLNIVLDESRPPVARCRLLSSGFAPYHTLNLTENIAGFKGCLACGNCIDVCPVIAREPRRQQRTPQRTSLALEVLVGEDCDRCDNCVLVCPQVDTTVKHYIVNTRMVEGMARLLRQVTSDEEVLWTLSEK